MQYGAGPQCQLWWLTNIYCFYMYKPVGDMGCSTSKVGIFLTSKAVS